MRPSNNNNKSSIVFKYLDVCMSVDSVVWCFFYSPALYARSCYFFFIITIVINRFYHQLTCENDQNPNLFHLPWNISARTTILTLWCWVVVSLFLCARAQVLFYSYFVGHSNLSWVKPKFWNIISNKMWQTCSVKTSWSKFTRKRKFDR